MRKPAMTIDLVGEEGNAYALMAKAQWILHTAGLSQQVNDLATEFEALAARPESTYQDIRDLAEKYCTVTWLNEHAKFKGAVVSTQEAASELAETLEALRVSLDADAQRSVDTQEAREQIGELRAQLDYLEAVLGTLPGKPTEANSKL